MAPTPRSRTARRFSNSCFSALIRAAKIALIFSWSDQRSSSDIDSSSSFFFDNIPTPCRINWGFNIAAPANNQEGTRLLPTRTKIVIYVGDPNRNFREPPEANSPTSGAIALANA